MADIAARGFCDIHHHLIWGVDHDGPRTMQESMDMALAAVQDGISDIITTPHVMPGIRPFDEGRYRDHLSQLQYWCHAQGLPLRLHTGAEIFYTPLTLQHLNQGRVPTLHTTRHVLVEFDPATEFRQLQRALVELASSGYLPILAHAERYPALVWHQGAVRRLREKGALALQINCSSIIRPKGFVQGRWIKAMLLAQAVDYVASDAHNRNSRPVQMRRAYQTLSKACAPKYLQRLLGGI